ncbi:MAG TPA: hypothetical protein VEB59_02445 [Gemmatimonadales bacterium]|nr:hypothetical protein [Gemmatimonadales bacterium]
MPGLPYLHQVVIGATPSGATDPDSGGWVPGPAGEAPYNGAADVQDGQVAIAFDGQGLPTKHAAAAIYLADEAKVVDVAIGMTGTVTGDRYSGEDFVVVGTRRIDGVVFVDWLADEEG